MRRYDIPGAGATKMSDTARTRITAILLSAGVGRRLDQPVPKVLARIGDATLLERHLALLAQAGVDLIAITIGHQGDLIRRAVQGAQCPVEVRFVENERYREGSLGSLSRQDELLRRGDTVLLMDGDVLYDRRMLERLLSAPGEAVMLVDRNIEPGDEPVKICFRGETIVDFRKRPEHAHDWHGESVGFFRFSPAMAKRLADRCDAHGRSDNPLPEYEEAIRDLILEEATHFYACDVSDLPWTEIDFPEDLARARDIIHPRLVP